MTQRKEYLLKTKIIKTFAELVELYNYEDITVRIICESVPVSRQTFYRYFRSKDDLVQQGVEIDFMEKAFPLFRYHLKEQGCAAFFLYILDHAAVYQKLFDHDGGILLEHCFRETYFRSVNFVEIYSRKVETKPDKIDPYVYRYYSSSGIAAVVTYWIRNKMAIPVEQIARDLYLMLEHPLGYVRDYYMN